MIIRAYVNGIHPFPHHSSAIIDEVSLYDRALAADEIQGIFDAGADGKRKHDVDIRAMGLQWNTAQAGVDFRYEITGADLTDDTTAALYWAVGPDIDDVLSPAVYQVTVDRPAGSYGPFFVPNSILGAPPTGATHLLLALDPPTPAMPDGLIDESDETNNVLAIGIPDLRATALEYRVIADATGQANGPLPFNGIFDAEVIVENVGVGTSSEFEVAVYASEDAVIEDSDVLPRDEIRTFARGRSAADGRTLESRLATGS